MPVPIMELVEKVKNFSDYLVIATPYHDMASQERRNWKRISAQGVGERWIRNIDPFLFGFLRQIPDMMFFLGRWSGTGMFPLIGDMIADTIQHMKNNKELLVNIRRDARWYREDDKNIDEWREFARVVPCPLLKPIKEYKPRMGWFMPSNQEKLERWKRENHTLVRFSNNIIKQFQRGRLFSWLRGED
jgi:hypothetical protein